MPTWNYAAVHVKGTVSLLDPDQTFQVVEQSLEKYEPDLLEKKDFLTDEYRDMLLPYIVGFEVSISNLSGKLKLGQNRGSGDQVGIFKALSKSESLESQSLAKFMARYGVRG